jgi:predicted nucleic acid-binding protein
VIAVDSSVWIDFYRGANTAQVELLTEHLDAGEPTAITDVIYMELLRGARTDSELARVKLRIDQTEILQVGGLDDFAFAADLFRRARRKGHTIRQATDCLIAAVCIREDVPLLHDDIDFDRIVDVSDLKVA